MNESLKDEETHESVEHDQINIKRSWDLNHWCEEFNLRADELKEIVQQVGPSVHDVRMHLAKKLLINWPVSY